MLNTIRQTHSNLQISEEVICTIARCAAKEIDGVAGFSNKNLDLRQLLLHGRTPKAISVEVIDGSAVIDLNIIVKYGIRLTELAPKVQAAVKNAVQSMTGIRVARVNVHIADICFGEND